jgi:integrase
VRALSDTTARDYFLFVLFTGTRREEAATLQWENVNFREHTFTLLDTKNGEDVTLPMSSYVEDILENRRSNTTYVFENQTKPGYFTSQKRPTDLVRNNSGIYFSLHDLRRTFLTIAESLDISQYTLKRLVNHKVSSNDVTAGYIISDPQRLGKATQSITDQILETIRAADHSSVDKKEAAWHGL